MAVVAPPPFPSKPDFWGAGTASAHPLESPESMTEVMAYQYPPPPNPNGADLGMSASAYMSDYGAMPSGSGMAGQDAGIDSKERRDSMSKSLKLKRSLSSPNVRAPQPPPQAQPNLPPPDHSALGLAAEKRRNKLGYHRTSVACGK